MDLAVAAVEPNRPCSSSSNAVSWGIDKVDVKGIVVRSLLALSLCRHQRPPPPLVPAERLHILTTIRVRL